MYGVSKSSSCDDLGCILEVEGHLSIAIFFKWDGLWLPDFYCTSASRCPSAIAELLANPQTTSIFAFFVGFVVSIFGVQIDRS